MPLFISKSVLESSKLGVWLIEEDDAYFSSRLSLLETEEKLVNKLKGKRKVEWLSSRHLIHLLSERDERATILKDRHGKPYIEDSDHYISFSHSHGMSAAMASKNVVGIDIQYLVPKIARIAHKFINKKESSSLEKVSEEHRIEIMHIIWGAKESLYKAYGQRSLRFKDHMQLEHISWDGHTAEFKGSVTKDSYNAIFDLKAEKINNHILVYAEQI